MTAQNGVSERFEVWQVEEKKFSVLSLDSTAGRPRQYCVQFNGYRWLCNCPHFLKHAEDVNFACKHIVAVMQVIGKRTIVEKKIRENKRNGRRGEKEKELSPQNLPNVAIEGNKLRCHNCRSGNLEMLIFKPNGDKALEIYQCRECGEIQKNLLV